MKIHARFRRIIDAGERPWFQRCHETYLPQLLTLTPLTPGFTPGPHPNVQQLAPRKGSAGNATVPASAWDGVKKSVENPTSVRNQTSLGALILSFFFVWVWASQARGPAAMTRRRKDRDPGMRREVRLTRTRPSSQASSSDRNRSSPLRSVRIRSWTGWMIDDIRCGGGALIARELRAGLLKIHSSGIPPALPTSRRQLHPVHAQQHCSGPIRYDDCTAVG